MDSNPPRGLRALAVTGLPSAPPDLSGDVNSQFHAVLSYGSLFVTAGGDASIFELAESVVPCDVAVLARGCEEGGVNNFASSTAVAASCLSSVSAAASSNGSANRWRLAA